MEKIVKIAQTVIDELDSFDKNFNPKSHKNPQHKIGFNSFTNSESNPNYKLEKITSEVHLENQRLAREPFISYVKVIEEKEGSEPQEKIYLFCRNYIPNIDPISVNTMYANRNGLLGQIPSMNVGDSKELTIKTQYKKIKKTFTLIEKSDYRLVKKELWDTVENNVSYNESLDSIYLESTREFLSEYQEEKISGLDLVKELEDVGKSLY